MNLRTLVPVTLTAFALAACSGGSGGGSVVGSNSITPQSPALASGTLSVSLPVSNSASTARKPAFISSSTTNATLYINGTLSSRIGCTATCTFSWTSISGSQTFAAEIDDGHNVLGEGSHAYTLNVGNNSALTALTVNGVVSTMGGWSNPETAISTTGESGTFTISDFDSNAITNAGSSLAFDNGSPTFTTNYPLIGSVTISSSLTPTVSGTAYAYSVACLTGQTGTFNIVGTTGSPSLDVSVTNLTANGSLAYPGSTITGTVYTYTCTSGVISDAYGTITLQ
jgi:hypothetical protein